MSEELQAEIERLRKANFQLREGSEEQKQRIKRLEEAGDELVGTVEAMDAWRKAKEATP